MRVIIVSAFAALLLSSINPSASAQVYTQSVYYAPQPTTFVQRAPTVAAPAVRYAQPTTVYRPALRPWTTVTVPASQPVVQASYYAPQPVVVSRPVVSAPVQVVRPAPVVSTRYRPILGGTVTRTWYP